MEKIIELDILKEETFIEKYNNNKVNNDLIEYLIKQARNTTKDDEIKIIINNRAKIKGDLEDKIVQGLKEEYNNISNEYVRNNIIQLLLLFLGVFFLFLSTLIDEKTVWKEVVLIIGWVPIWEMVDLELFKDFRNRRKRRIIVKLLTCKYEINEK